MWNVWRDDSTGKNRPSLLIDPCKSSMWKVQVLAWPGWWSPVMAVGAGTDSEEEYSSSTNYALYDFALQEERPIPAWETARSPWHQHNPGWGLPFELWLPAVSHAVWQGELWNLTVGGDGGCGHPGDSHGSTLCHARVSVCCWTVHVVV